MSSVVASSEEFYRSALLAGPIRCGLFGVTRSILFTDQ